jgi:hypothetical protein
MATVPNPRTWAALYNVQPADLNLDLRDAVNFLINPPCVQAHQASAQSIPNNTFTAVTLDTVDQLGGGDTMWVTGSNTRFTAQTAGTYQISGQVTFVANATGERAAKFRLNGSADVSEPIENPGAGGPTTVSLVAFHLHLNVGDYIELMAYQNSGGSLNTYANAEACFALARWVSNQ